MKIFVGVKNLQVLSKFGFSEATSSESYIKEHLRVLIYVKLNLRK